MVGRWPRMSGAHWRDGHGPGGIGPSVGPAPFVFVGGDVAGRRLRLVGVSRHPELVLPVDDGRVQTDVVVERCGHLGVAQGCLPGADGLARLAVDALVGVDVELVRELGRGWSHVLVDAVDGAYFDARCVEAVPAQAGNYPGHRCLLSRARHPHGGSTELNCADLSAPRGSAVTMPGEDTESDHMG